MTRLTGRRFALVELSDVTDFDGRIIYAFEVREAPAWRVLRRWVHVAAVLRLSRHAIPADERSRP